MPSLDVHIDVVFGLSVEMPQLGEAGRRGPGLIVTLPGDAGEPGVIYYSVELLTQMLSTFHCIAD